MYVESGNARILIDTGLSLKKLKERMAGIDRNVEDLDAVFLTHEHRDHIGGIGPLINKTKKPYYTTEGTYKGVKRFYGPIPGWQRIDRQGKVTLGDLTIESFPTPHDAHESVAFVVHNGSKKLGHVTDLGCVTETVCETLQGVNTLLVESNHDVEMLRNGPYPYQLRKRVEGKYGHLSNEACAEILTSVRHPQLNQVVLMHLSEKNNCPDLALEIARRALEGHAPNLTVAKQDATTPLTAVS